MEAKPDLDAEYKDFVINYKYLDSQKISDMFKYARNHGVKILSATQTSSYITATGPVLQNMMNAFSWMESFETVGDLKFQLVE